MYCVMYTQLIGTGKLYCIISYNYLAYYNHEPNFRDQPFARKRICKRSRRFGLQYFGCKELYPYHTNDYIGTSRDLWKIAVMMNRPQSFANMHLPNHSCKFTNFFNLYLLISEIVPFVPSLSVSVHSSGMVNFGCNFKRSEESNTVNFFWHNAIGTIVEDIARPPRKFNDFF